VTVWIALAATTALLVLGAAVQMWALWFRETPGRASDEPEAPWLTGGECRHPWRYRQVLSRSPSGATVDVRYRCRACGREWVRREGP